MALMPGMRGQQTRDLMFDASGVIAAGAAAQLLLPEAKSRSFLLITNLHLTEIMYVDFGSARATAVITSGAVTSFVVVNAGFGFTRPPKVSLLGGGDGGNSSFLGVGEPGYPAPGDAGMSAARFTDMSGQRPAKAHAVLTADAVTSIVIEDPGAGYVIAPYVFITNDPLDPYGVAIPSATSGIPIPANTSLIFDRAVPTDPVSIVAASTNHAFACKWLA